MKFSFSLNHIGAVLFLIYCIEIPQSYSGIPTDSTDSTNISKGHVFRYMIGGAPVLAFYSKLGTRTISHYQPTALDMGKLNTLEWDIEFGLGYRKMNALFKFGPLGKIEISRSNDEYDENDSLKILDQYYLAHLSLELFHSWYFKNKQAKMPFCFELTPLTGYRWFLRKYDGRVQNLKFDENILNYQERAVSRGFVLGGQTAIIYYLGKKEEKNEKYNSVIEEGKGPFVSISYRHFADIGRSTFETGWIITGSKELLILEQAKFFVKIDVFRGAIEGTTYKIGFSGLNSF